MLPKKSLSFISILLFSLFLYNCGGGGGGVVSSSGGGGTTPVYSVPTCSDSGSSSIKTDEYYGMGSGSSTHGLARVCASAAYERGATGSGIDVAVVDTGIPLFTQYSPPKNYHIAFGPYAGDLDSNKLVLPANSDYVNGDSIPSDGSCLFNSCHGQHVAGIIGAKKDNESGNIMDSTGMHGVAYDSRLYIFKGLTDAGGTDSTLGNSMNGAINAGVDIINNSWGSDSQIGVNCNSASSCEAAIGSTIYSAMEAAGTRATPIINVFAAGNDGYDQPSIEAGAMIYDDDFKNTQLAVVAVGTDGKIASYSNKCGLAADYCIAAPGSGINAPGSFWAYTYTTKNGTSMAAPMVSGGLALIMQEFSSLTPAQVVNRLFVTALDTEEYSQSSIYGHGLMNLNSATQPLGNLQIFQGSNNLNNNDAQFSNLNENQITSSNFINTNILNKLKGNYIEVYDSYDQANFKVDLSQFVLSKPTYSDNATYIYKNKKDLFEEIENDYLNFYTQNNKFIITNKTNSINFALNPELSPNLNQSEYFSNDLNEYSKNPYYINNDIDDYKISFSPIGSFKLNYVDNPSNTNKMYTLQFAEESTDIQLGINYEKNKLLNTGLEGVFNINDYSDTSFVSFNKNYNINDFGSILFSSYLGATKFETKNSYLFYKEPIISSKLSLSYVKNNFIEKNNKLYVGIHQPQHIEKGSIDINFPYKTNSNKDVEYKTINLDLEDNKRNFDSTIGFVKEFNSNTFMGLKAANIYDPYLNINQTTIGVNFEKLF